MALELERVTEHVLSVDVTPRALGSEFIRAYIIVSKGEVAVIETGATSSVPILKKALERAGLAEKVKALFPTHVHLDHGGGTGTALRAFPSAAAYVHPRALPHLVDPSELWEQGKVALQWVAEVFGKPEPLQPLQWVAEVFGKPEPASKERLVATNDGMKIKVGDVILKVIHTPGHASHHQSVLLEQESILFVGDSAGIYLPSVGFALPATPPPLRLDMYVESIDKQIALSPSKIAYTHGGVGGDGKALKELRERVITWFEVVRDALASGVASDEELLRMLSERDRKFERVEAALRGEERYSLLLRLLTKLSIEGLKIESERLKDWAPER